MAKTSVETTAALREELLAAVEEKIGQQLADFETVVAREVDEKIKEVLEQTAKLLDIVTEQKNVSEAVKPIEEPTLPKASVLQQTQIFETIKSSAASWYPWVKFTFWVVIGLAVWQFIVFPVLSGKSVKLPWSSKTVAPAVDVSTPAGAAVQEMQNEPFRSDTASRQTFGRIFDELDTLVASGQIIDLEGYYDTFGKRMQESIPADRYNQWAGIWNKLAGLAYRQRNGSTDVKAFNNQLQSAAAVVAGRTNNFSAEYPPALPVYNPPLPSPPVSTPAWQYNPIGQ
jgi:hypothetical protein